SHFRLLSNSVRKGLNDLRREEVIDSTDATSLVPDKMMFATNGIPFVTDGTICARDETIYVTNETISVANETSCVAQMVSVVDLDAQQNQWLGGMVQKRNHLCRRKWFRLSPTELFPEQPEHRSQAA